MTQAEEKQKFVDEVSSHCDQHGTVVERSFKRALARLPLHALKSLTKALAEPVKPATNLAAFDAQKVRTD